MDDLRSKFFKAVDAFSDVLTEDVSSTKYVALYKYSDLKSFVVQTRKEFPFSNIFRVSMTKQNEFDGMVFPEAKYIIRVLALDENRQPICIEGNNSAYLGTITIASSVDTKMNKFMNGKTERTVAIKGGK